RQSAINFCRRERFMASATSRTIGIALLTSLLSSGIVGVLVTKWVEYDTNRRLESHKRDIELRFNDQVRLRKLYEELSMTMEDLYGTMPKQNPAQLGIAIHKMFALLALYAPDDVYRQVRTILYSREGRILYAQDVRPPLYYALRKSVFGETTQL